MNNEEQQDDMIEEQDQLENGPGHLLVKKREALGMSVQEVADTLHITMHYVRALETDAHDKLPGDVFIKGYLRSYANLLQLDPSVIVNVYIDYSSERANAVESSTRRHTSKRTIPWLVVSGVAFVGMAIALWYFNSGTPAPVRTVGAPAAANAANVSTRTVRSGAATTLDEMATTVEVPSVPVQIEVPAPSPVVEEQVLPAQETDQEVTLPVEVTPAADAATQPAEVLAPENVEQGETLTPERLISIDGGGEDLVQFTFTGQSMVQVIDANDEQLYRDVRVAGDQLRISGTAPFNILLGDASNSELSFNGDKVDFSSSIRIDNSARLTIGL